MYRANDVIGSPCPPVVTVVRFCHERPLLIHLHSAHDALYSPSRCWPPCTSRSATSPATTIAIWPGQLASEPQLFTLRQHTRAICTNSECLKENLYIVHRKANHPDVKIARSLDPRLIFRTCQVPPGIHVGD